MQFCLTCTDGSTQSVPYSENSSSSANRIDTEISSNCDRKQSTAVAHTLWPSRTLPGRFGDGPCWHGARDAVEPESGDGVRGELSPRCVILCFVIILLVALVCGLSAIGTVPFRAGAQDLCFFASYTVTRLTRLKYQGTCSSHDILPVPWSALH
jgi:hypothetical protein